MVDNDGENTKHTDLPRTPLLHMLIAKFELVASAAKLLKYEK